MRDSGFVVSRVVALSILASVALAASPSFADSVVWTGGGSDSLASNGDNWEGGSAPTAGQVVTFSSDETTWSKPMTWDLDVELGGWMQNGYTGVVTFTTVFADSGLTGSTCVTIKGDVTLNTGSWTHLPNSQNKKEYRLSVAVTGDMTIGANATIQADGCGYTISGGGGHKKADSNSAGCYGGHGGQYYSYTFNYTYGSYSAPADDLGGGGRWNKNLPGGGAIKIVVGGTLTHNGAVRANGVVAGTHYYGAGGGIELVAGSIAGTGTIKANSPAGNTTGGGGRIAVKLTKAGSDFANYDIVALAEAVCEGSPGEPGTIYAETAADTAGEGWLIMKGTGAGPRTCDPLPDGAGSYHVSKLTLTNNVTLTVGAGRTLDLSGTAMSGADVSGKSNSIKLDGGTIVFDGTKATSADVGCAINCVSAAPTITTDSLVCKPGGVLTLATDYSYSGDLVLDGGQLIAQGNLTVSGDTDVKSGGTFCTDATTTIGGSLTVEDGGVVTCEGPRQTTATMKRLELHVAGDVWVKEGGAIDVKGKGYSTSWCPTGKVSGNGGTAHGGLGTRSVAAYDSIYAPTMAGSGSSHADGGGIAVLVVSGQLRNDGVIRACGNLSYYHGAGGSIFVTAGSLAGAGTMDVRPGDTDSSYGEVTGGGRISVVLTDPSADFASIPLERFLAGGGRTGKQVGGAGTVYLRTGAQAADEGTLYICNAKRDNSTTFKATPLADGVVEGTAFGSVIITNGANVTLAAGGAITVKGDWLNYGTFSAGAGSMVSLAGSATCRIVGNTAFASLGATAPGKRIEVASGTTLTVGETFSFAGTAEAKLSLVCSDPSGTWNLVNNGVSSLTGVRLQGCQASNPLTVVNGEDGDGNSANITFVTIAPGEEIVWQGTTSGAWGVASNWDRNRTPIDTDNVVIRAGGNPATLDSGVQVASLTVESGASLAVGNRSLAVTGNVTQNGTLSVGTGGSTSIGGNLVQNGTLSVAADASVSVGGDVTLSGTCSLSGSELTLNGGAVQTLSVASGISLPTVRTLSPALTVATSLDCAAFAAGDGATACAVSFVGGTTLAANRFDVTGAAGNLVTLAGKDSAVWNLKTSVAHVDYAHVTGSDASSAVLILPTHSTDGGHNVNWMFEDTRVHWDGVSPTTINDDVVIDAGSDFTISAPREMKSLTVSGGAALTVNDALTLAGSVTVESGATLTWNRPGTIGGNLVLLSGAVLTHTANTDQEVNKLSLDIAGSGVIQAGAIVDAKGKGYTTGKGPGSKGNGNIGGSYGGRGYYNNSAIASAPCYGSYVCPTNCGSGGGEAASVLRSTIAGGAVRLAFGGNLTVDGTVRTDGRDEQTDGYYTGTGGSVWITARSLTGSGSITADGGNGSAQYFGAGGRISLELTGTGAAFAAFTGAVHAWGGARLDVTNPYCMGSAGTVFLKTAADTGVVCLNNDPLIAGHRVDAKDFTDFPSEVLCDPDELLNRDVVLDSYATLNLMRDYRIRSLTVNGTTPRILLNGHVLKVAVRPKAAVREAILALTVPGEDEKGNPGRIKWDEGFMLIVR